MLPSLLEPPQTTIAGMQSPNGKDGMEDDNRSWLSFKTLSSGGSNYGDPENTDQDEEDFHDPAKGVSFIETNLQSSPKKPFEADDRRTGMHVRPDHFDMHADGGMLHPLKPSQHTPLLSPSTPPHIMPPHPPDYDVMEASGGGELVSTSVSLFAPNWWDRMANGDASSPQLVHNQFSNASSIEVRVPCNCVVKARQ